MCTFPEPVHCSETPHPWGLWYLMGPLCSLPWHTSSSAPNSEQRAHHSSAGNIPESLTAGICQLPSKKVHSTNSVSACGLLMSESSKIRCTTFYLSMFITHKDVFGSQRRRGGFTPRQVAHYGHCPTGEVTD